MGKFKTGDMFISHNGWQGGNGESFEKFTIFEYDSEEVEGKGFKYSSGGERYGYMWAHPHSENKLFDIDEDIIFSFRHGSSEFKVKSELLNSITSCVDLIKNSDFRYVSVEEVQISKSIEAIDNLDDIKDNWELIKANGATLNIAEICLKACGVKLGSVKNGEIGIYTMNVMNLFNNNISNIETELSF